MAASAAGSLRSLLPAWRASCRCRDISLRVDQLKRRGPAGLRSTGSDGRIAQQHFGWVTANDEAANPDAIAGADLAGIWKFRGVERLARIQPDRPLLA